MNEKRIRAVLYLLISALFLFLPAFVFAGGAKECQDALTECKSLTETLQRDNDDLQAENKRLKSQNDDLETRVADLEAQNKELEQEIADYESLIAVWQAEFEAYGLEPEDPSIVAKTVEETLTQKDAQIVRLEADVEEMREDLDQAQRSLQRSQRDLEQARRDLERARQDLSNKNRELQQANRQVSDLNQEVANCNREAEQLQIESALLERKMEDLSEENEELLQAITSYEIIQEEALALMDIALDRINDVLAEEIAAGKVRVFKGSLGLTLDVVSEYMFEMGSTEMNPGGKTILGKIAGLLEDLDGYFIGIIGNADAKPIVTPALKERYPTNWELSAYRGAVVVRYMLQNGNISPRRIVAMGLGENQPIDSNMTEDGRGNNRRIDIMLLPVDVLAAVVIGAEIK